MCMCVIVQRQQKINDAIFFGGIVVLWQHCDSVMEWRIELGSVILGMRIASAALFQIGLMADHGRKAPGEREILSPCLRSTQIESRSCTEGVVLFSVSGFSSVRYCIDF